MQDSSRRFGSCLMTGLKGPEISREEREFFLSCRPGGVILFRRNILSLKQTYALCRELKALYPPPALPPLVAVDLEGGRVNRFSHIQEGFPLPAPEEMGRLKPSEIFSLATILGRRLRALGIDINFAPVVDIPRKKSAVLKGRIFSLDPKTLIACAGAFTEGLMKEGVLPCLKHFPGHGGVRGDSHKTLPRDNRTLKELDLQPFRELKFCPLIMTAHVEFKNIDPGPAVFSRRLLEDVLRRRIRFQGVIVSDDMDMKAVAGRPPGERFLKALAGGCDLILCCQKPKTPREICRFFFQRPERLSALTARLKSAKTRTNRLRQRQKNLPALSWAKANRILSSSRDQKRLEKPIRQTDPAEGSVREDI